MGTSQLLQLTDGASGAVNVMKGDQWYTVHTTQGWTEVIFVDRAPKASRLYLGFFYINTVLNQLPSQIN